MSGIPSWAVKGAKVVCVNVLPIFSGQCGPEAGRVYRILDVKISPLGNPSIEVSGLIGFWMIEGQFRPITDTHLEADLRMFRDIADKAGAPSELTNSDLERMAHDVVFENGSGM